MPTAKKRIYITLDSELEEAIKMLAKRDDVAEATKAAQLLKKAMEDEEDEVLAMIAEERIAERKRKKLDLIPFEDVFGA